MLDADKDEEKYFCVSIGNWHQCEFSRKKKKKSWCRFLFVLKSKDKMIVKEIQISLFEQIIAYREFI